MPINAENWIEDLEDIRLPALSYSKRQLDKILNRPATSHTDLGAIVSLDPGLSIQMFLELSRHLHQPKEPVSDPIRVISLLGMAKVHNMAAKVPTLEERYRGPALDGLRRSYGRAILAARFARLLSSLRARSNMEDSAVTALLQGIGEMALWAKRPGSMNLLLTDAHRQEDVDLVSLRRFDARPSDLGANLARHWHLPQHIILVQHLHNSIDSNVQLPLLAADLAWSAFRNWQSDVMEELIQLAAELVHLDPDIVRPALHKETAVAARLAHERGLPHTADGLLLALNSAGPEARFEARKPSRKAKPTPTAEPGRSPPEMERPKKPAPAPAARQTTPEPAPALPAVQSARKSTVVPAPRPEAASPAQAADGKPAASPPKNQMMDRLSQILRRMREDTGMERVLFAMLTQERTELRGRILLEDKPSGLSAFKASARTRNLFALLLSKPHALWVNSGNLVKYTPLIPEQTATLVSTKGFFVVSIVAKKRPIGLIYGDADGCKLDTNRFEAFKKYCHQVNKLFSGS